MLELDRDDRFATRLEEINLGDQSKALGGHRNRRARWSRLSQLVWLRRSAALAVDATMVKGALGGVGVVLKAPVHPLEVCESWAVNVLVEHAGRDEIGFGVQRS